MAAAVQQININYERSSRYLIHPPPSLGTCLSHEDVCHPTSIGSYEFGAITLALVGHVQCVISIGLTVQSQTAVHG